MLKKILSTSFFLFIFIGLWATVINQVHAANTSPTISLGANSVAQKANTTITINGLGPSRSTNSYSDSSNLRDTSFTLSLINSATHNTADSYIFSCTPTTPSVCTTTNTKSSVTYNASADNVVINYDTSNLPVGAYTFTLSYEEFPLSIHLSSILGSITLNTPSPTLTITPQIIASKGSITLSAPRSVNYGDKENITIGNINNLYESSAGSDAITRDQSRLTKVTLNLYQEPVQTSAGTATGVQNFSQDFGCYIQTTSPPNGYCVPWQGGSNDFGGNIISGSIHVSTSSTGEHSLSFTVPIDTTALKLGTDAGGYTGPDRSINYAAQVISSSADTGLKSDLFTVQPALQILSIIPNTGVKPKSTIKIEIQRLPNVPATELYNIGILNGNVENYSSDTTEKCQVQHTPGNTAEQDFTNCTLSFSIPTSTEDFNPSSYDIYVRDADLRDDMAINGSTQSVSPAKVVLYDPVDVSKRTPTSHNIDVTSGTPPNALYGTDAFWNNSSDTDRVGLIFTDAKGSFPCPTTGPSAALCAKVNYKLTITKPINNNGKDVVIEDGTTAPAYVPKLTNGKNPGDTLMFFVNNFNLDDHDAEIGTYNYKLTYQDSSTPIETISFGSFKILNPISIAKNTFFIPGTSQTVPLYDLSPNQHYAIFLPTGTLSGYTFGTADDITTHTIQFPVDVANMSPPSTDTTINLCLTNKGFDSAWQSLKNAINNLPGIGGLLDAELGNLPSGISNQNPDQGECTFHVQVKVGPAPSPTPTPTPPLPPCLQYVYDNNGTPVPLKSSIDSNGNFTIPSHDGGTPYPYRCAQVNTIFGAFDTDASGFIAKIFTIILSISGGIVIASIIYAGYRILTSNGNPETLKAARERLTGAIIGLLFIIFSLVLLQFIGVDILGIPGFGK